MYLLEVLPFIRAFVGRVYPGIQLERIEFSATPAASKEMLRYMSFEELEQRLLSGEAFSRLEVGPAYSVPVYTFMNQQSSEVSCLAVYAPFKIDFDLVGRACCDDGDKKVGKKQCCLKCWEEIVMPLFRETEAAMLKRDAENAVHGARTHRRHWFYTGGRGVHVWFEDPLLAVMDSADRRQYVERVVMPLVPAAWRQYLDRDVSAKINHLMRCPMSLHDFKRIPSSPLVEGKGADFYLRPFRDVLAGPQERDQHLALIKAHLAQHT